MQVLQVSQVCNHVVCICAHSEVASGADFDCDVLLVEPVHLLVVQEAAVAKSVRLHVDHSVCFLRLFFDFSAVQRHFES